VVNILGRCTSAVLDCVITSRRSTIVVHSIAMSLSVCLSRCKHNKQYVEDDHEALGEKSDVYNSCIVVVVVVSGVTTSLLGMSAKVAV